MNEFSEVIGFNNYLISKDGDIVNKSSGRLKQPVSNHSGKGYLYVDLYNGGKRKRAYVHRLVAEAFIANPKKSPYVNHIDGNPHNNTVENLEWCTPLENVQHASKVIKTMDQYRCANERRKRKVMMVDKSNMKPLRTFESINDAERLTGIPASNIVACLKGRQSYTRDVRWCYVEEQQWND